LPKHCMTSALFWYLPSSQKPRAFAIALPNTSDMTLSLAVSVTGQ